MTDSVEERFRQAIRASPRLRVVRLVMRSSKPLMAGLVVDIVATAVLPVLTMVTMGWMVSRIPPAVSDGWDSPSGDRLVTALVAVGLVFFLAMLTKPLHEWLAAEIKARLTFAMRTRLMTAVSKPVGIAHLGDPAVLDRVAMSQGTLMHFYPADAPGTLAAVVGRQLQWIAGCVVIGTLRWWLGVLLFLVWVFAKRPLLRAHREYLSAFTSNATVMRRAGYFHILSTKPAAAKELRVFGLGAWAVERFRSRWKEGMTEPWRIRRRNYATSAVLGVGVAATYLGACAVIAKAAYDGEITLGQVAVFLPVLFITMQGGTCGFDDVRLEWNLAAMPELDALETDLAERRRALHGDLPATGHPHTAIRFEGVRFRYPGATVDVFSGLDLELPANRSTAIVGANGAGKTTLVKLLARLHDPAAGRITVDGTPLQHLDPIAWQRKVAVVFQDFARLPVTAGENIGLGSREHLDDREGILACADLAGIRDWIESLPSGWETPLTRQLTGGADLSGGQWQRLALARALFAARHGASILVLDEPTSWLDARGEAAFFENFLDITAGLTTIVISHRFSTVRLADQICVVNDGRVAEVGSHDELVSAPGLYRRMFRLQAARFADHSVERSV